MLNIRSAPHLAPRGAKISHGATMTPTHHHRSLIEAIGLQLNDYAIQAVVDRAHAHRLFLAARLLSIPGARP